MAWNQTRSGLRVPSKIVPAVMDVWRAQLRQRMSPRMVVQPPLVPQAGQTNPLGHLSLCTYRAHAASEANHVSNSASVRG